MGLLVDRTGSVSHVFVGDAKAISVPELGRFRNATGRLKGLRWISTLLRGDEPGRDDLNALVRWRLDMLLLVGVDAEGEVAFLREVHLAPAEDDGSGVYDVGELDRPDEYRRDLLAHLHELEAEFERAAPRARETGGDQQTPALLAVVGTRPKWELERELEELRQLARAAGLDVKGEVVQRRERFNPHTLLGQGRVSDLAALALTTDAQVVVLNEELAPRQQVALEDLLNLRVIDRTQLILDIFASRARTHAGKLQVESARLRYMLPRLIGKGTGLTQIGGGKGAGFARTKGAGEKKLEIYRRRIRERLDGLEAELKRLRQQRSLRRARRQKNRLPHVALVGYTNVGKSTLFNRLTDASVLEEDMMFASLDPTLRQRLLPGGQRVVFSDSVGFIERLPKDLVNAFGATLDELEDASLLLHVADASDPRVLERVDAVRKLLRELGRADLPELLVFNKLDAVEDPSAFGPLARTAGKQPLMISAREGDLSPLVERIETSLAESAVRA